MEITRAELDAGITASGGAVPADHDANSLLEKLLLLEKTNRYALLLKTIRSANDKWNFLAALLEANFAYQFERVGMPLQYEVRQEQGQPTSIDFALKTEVGLTAFFELRLLQEDATTSVDIAKQLEQGQAFAVKKDGAAEQKAIARLQQTVLQKVQDKNGNPIKFMHVANDAVNVVVIAVSDILLGTVDAWDCLLAMYGDPEVPEHCRRDIFGLFQEAAPAYPEHIQKRAASFAHVRGVLHGVMFLFRADPDGPLNYGLEHLIVWNRHLMTAENAKAIGQQVSAALPPRKNA